MVGRPRAGLRLTAVAVAMLVGIGTARTANARALLHPLHTTLSELRYESREGIVRVTVRLFADDLGGALRRRGEASPPESRAGAAATLAYLGATFILAGRDGRPLPMRLEEVRRTGDLLWVTVTVPSRAGLTGLTLRNDLLTELFADQVNIVQVTDGSVRRSLLFTRGAGVRSL